MLVVRTNVLTSIDAVNINQYQRLGLLWATYTGPTADIVSGSSDTNHGSLIHGEQPTLRTLGPHVWNMTSTYLDMTEYVPDVPGLSVVVVVWQFCGVALFNNLAHVTTFVFICPARRKFLPEKNKHSANNNTVRKKYGICFNRYARQCLHNITGLQIIILLWKAQLMITWSSICIISETHRCYLVID
jgi:hypothetical protein